MCAQSGVNPMPTGPGADASPARARMDWPAVVQSTDAAPTRPTGLGGQVSPAGWPDPSGRAPGTATCASYTLTTGPPTVSASAALMPGCWPTSSGVPIASPGAVGMSVDGAIGAPSDGAGTDDDDDGAVEGARPLQAAT